MLFDLACRLRYFKSLLINPKTIEQLKRRAGEKPRKGGVADPEVYRRIRSRRGE